MAYYLDIFLLIVKSLFWQSQWLNSQIYIWQIIITTIQNSCSGIRFNSSAISWPWRLLFMSESSSAYLDGLLDEKHGDQHPEKLPCNPCESVDYVTGIEYRQQEQQQSSPHTYPATTTTSEVQLQAKSVFTGGCSQHLPLYFPWRDFLKTVFQLGFSHVLGFPHRKELTVHEKVGKSLDDQIYR